MQNWYKTNLLIQPCYLNFLICRFELFCRSVIHLIGSISLSSPPVAGVWWAHWRGCPVAAVASSKWMLHTGGGWGETPHMIVKRFGCTTIHKKRYIIASFIQINASFSSYTGFEPELLDCQVRLRTPWPTEQTYHLWKPIDMKLDMYDTNVQKHQFSNLPVY